MHLGVHLLSLLLQPHREQRWLQTLSSMNANSLYRYAKRHAFRTKNGSTWLGVPIIKYPQDLLIYQQILMENRPDLIIETGTFMGGSALYLASICDLLNHGQVLTIDKVWRERRPHPRITYWTGRSTSTETMNEVKKAIGLI